MQCNAGFQFAKAPKHSVLARHEGMLQYLVPLRHWPTYIFVRPSCIFRNVQYVQIMHYILAVHIPFFMLGKQRTRTELFIICCYSTPRANTKQMSLFAGHFMYMYGPAGTTVLTPRIGSSTQGHELQIHSTYI